MRALLVAIESSGFALTMAQVRSFEGRTAGAFPLGLITVAGLLPRDWELRLSDLNIRPIREEEWAWAEVVLVSGMLPQRAGLLEVLAQAKERGLITIAGGPYPTSLPEEVRAAGGDFVVRGEAEGILGRVLEDLEQGIPGGIYRAREPVDLTSSPLPRFDLLEMEAYGMAFFQTTRGCPFDCEFCDIANLNGRKIRHKTTSQVLAELSEIYRLGWRNHVFIADDNFIGDRSWALEMAGELDRWLDEHGRPFPFWFQSSLDLAGDETLIDALTQANLSVIFLGVETIGREALKTSGKVSVLRSDPARDLARLNESGLTVVASFVIGLDGEPDNVAEGILDLLDQAKVPLALFFTLHILPGTRLWKRLEGEGRLLKDHGIYHSDPEPLNYLPQRPEADILRDYLKLWSKFYQGERFYQRTRETFLALRPTRKALALARGEPPPAIAPKGPRPFRYILRDLKSIIRFVFSQGIRSPFRAGFWRCLMTIRRRNPSRLIRLLNVLYLGMDMRSFSRTLEQRLDTLPEPSRPES